MMHRFTVPGAELAWSCNGESGPAVVQLHGLGSSRRRDQVQGLNLGRELSATRLLRYDTRGHGHSTGRADPEDYRWPALAEDLLNLLDHCLPDMPVHGVGASMGAATLLHAALRAPGRFSGFTLMLPPTAWDTRTAQAGDYRRLARFIEDHGMDRFVAASSRMPRPPATLDTPDTVPDVSGDLLPSIYRGAAMSDLPTREQIATLDIPTTILAWAEDPSHPLATAEALVALLPDATLHVAQSPQDVAGWPSILAAAVARSASHDD